MTVWISGADIILHAFCLPRHRVVHVAVQNFMQLQNVVPRNWNGIKIFVDDIQRITVSSNFLLISVSGRSFFFDQLADTCACGDNPLNRIGCFGALNLGDFHQLFQFLRALLEIHLLFSGFFIDCSNQPQDFRIPFLFADCCIVKISHSLTSDRFPLNYGMN